MSLLLYLSLIGVFLLASGLAYFVLSRFMPTAIQKRLGAIGDAGPAVSLESGMEPSGGERLRQVLEPLARPSLPEGGWEKSPLRIRFLNGGYRTMAAPIAYFACKTLLTFLLPGVLLMATGLGGHGTEIPYLLAELLLFATIGYYIPNAVLAHLIARRQRELFEHFPDALDLMRICVEAGLGLDAAIERVSEEMRLNSSTLADELHLVTLELRAGAARGDALRNLALRVGVEDIDSLVAMLAQADRFGTSIADSLRIHSEALRTKRRLRAEEAAAKIPVKLLMPLIFCIFPSLLVVLLGPAAISIYRVLYKTFTGG